MKRGRKTKLTPQLQKQICKLLAQGHTIATVCEAVGIGERTYFDWRELHSQFSQATTRAIGKSKITLVEKLQRADDWRAQAFLLERRWPNEFGRTTERALPAVENEGKKKVSIAFVLNTGGKTLEEVVNFPMVDEATAPVHKSLADTTPVSKELFDPKLDDLGPEDSP